MLMRATTREENHPPRCPLGRTIAAARQYVAKSTLEVPLHVLLLSAATVAALDDAHPRDVDVPPAQQTGVHSSRALDAQASTDRVRVHASTFDSVALMQWHSGHPTGQVTPC